MNLLAAELRKLTTVRTTWAVTAVGAVLVGVSASIYTFATELTGPFTGSAEDVATTVSQIGGNSVIVLVVGILAVTTEFRYGTIGRTLQLTPSRTRMMVAKLAAGGIYGVAFTALGLVVVAVLVAIAGAVNGVGLTVDGASGTALWEVLVGMVLTALLGVAVGALLRNQVLAIVLALVWVFVLENLFLALLPDVARWLPFQALQGVFTDPSAFSGAEGQMMAMDPLEPATALTVFLGYVVVATVAAVASMRYRDV